MPSTAFGFAQRFIAPRPGTRRKRASEMGLYNVPVRRHTRPAHPLRQVVELARLFAKRARIAAVRPGCHGSLSR